MRITLQGSANLQTRLTTIRQRIADPRPVLYDARKTLAQSMAINFFQAGRPQRWAERKRNYPWPILIKTGRLRSEAMGGGVNRLIGNKGLEFGTRVHYAPYHQMGTKKMVARPFLVLQPEDIQAITLSTRKYLWLW